MIGVDLECTLSSRCIFVDLLGSGVHRRARGLFSSVPIGRGFFVPMTLAADTQVVTEALSINSAIQFDRGYDLKYGYHGSLNPDSDG